MQTNEWMNEWMKWTKKSIEIPNKDKLKNSRKNAFSYVEKLPKQKSN